MKSVNILIENRTLEIKGTVYDALGGKNTGVFNTILEGVLMEVLHPMQETKHRLRFELNELVKG